LSLFFQNKKGKKVLKIQRGGIVKTVNCNELSFLNDKNIIIGYSFPCKLKKQFSFIYCSTDSFLENPFNSAAGFGTIFILYVATPLVYEKYIKPLQYEKH